MNLDKTTPSTKKCRYCKTIYPKKVNVSRKVWLLSKYCSRACKDKDLIGEPTWNTGIKIDREKYPNFGHLQKHTKEALAKITKANRRNAREKPKEFYQKIQKLAVESARKNGFKNYKGTLGKTKELNARWLGDKASYNSKHKWIQKYWLKTGICENCGKIPKPFGKRKWGTEWHSLDGKYNREDKETWKELCKRCHNKFDKGLL